MDAEILRQIATLPAKDLLGLAVLGAVVTTTGTLLALVLREQFFVRSFERWKARRDLERIYQKYRDPLILAATEVAIRCREIADGLADEYLDRALLQAQPPGLLKNWAGDPYYRRYKFQSSVYRICALFGWLELYRQEIVFLNSGRAKHTKRLGELVEAIREDFADGQINKDWFDSIDGLIFREEQRAIGETMITQKGDKRLVVGYGEFSAILEDRHGGGKWLDAGIRFIDRIGAHSNDFRTTRIKRLFIHLIDLIDTLDAARVWPNHRERRDVYWSQLPAWARERPSIQEKRTRVAAAINAERQGDATSGSPPAL